MIQHIATATLQGILILNVAFVAIVIINDALNEWRDR